MLFRDSHPEVFLRKGVLKVCSKFAAENTCPSVISIKLLCNFIQITLRHGCSPVNLLHIFRTPFTENTSERLLVVIKKDFNKAGTTIYAQQIFDYLQLWQWKTNFKMHSLTKILFGAKSSGSIFLCIYFFRLEIFPLYQTTKVFLPFTKRIIYHFHHMCAIQ